MIQGLQIAIRGDEMITRVAARAESHTAVARALDARIAERAGDLPYDSREEDGFKTLSELQEECQSHRERAAKLELLRDHLTPGETYALGRADLVVAELITRGAAEDGSPQEMIAPLPKTPIHGLKLTTSGYELRVLLEGRIKHHEDEAARLRDPARRGDDQALLGDEFHETLAARHEWRAGVLAFIRDHLETDQMYRLGKEDLQFGDLLGNEPVWIDSCDCEERACAS